MRSRQGLSPGLFGNDLGLCREGGRVAGWQGGRVSDTHSQDAIAPHVLYNVHTYLTLQTALCVCTFEVYAAATGSPAVWGSLYRAACPSREPDPGGGAPCQ